MQGVYHRRPSGKTLDSHCFAHDVQGSEWKYSMGCREKQTGGDGLSYGLSVESFLPKRLAKRIMPGDRSLGLKRTLRRCS